MTEQRKSESIGLRCETCQRPVNDVEYFLGVTKCGACQMAYAAALKQLRLYIQETA